MKVRPLSTMACAAVLALGVGFLSLGAILSFHARPTATGELVVALGGGGGPDRFALGYELARSGRFPYLLLIHPGASEFAKLKERARVDRPGAGGATRSRAVLSAVKC